MHKPGLSGGCLRTFVGERGFSSHGLTGHPVIMQLRSTHVTCKKWDISKFYGSRRDRDGILIILIILRGQGILGSWLGHNSFKFRQFVPDIQIIYIAAEISQKTRREPHKIIHCDKRNRSKHLKATGISCHLHSFCFLDILGSLLSDYKRKIWALWLVPLCFN